MFPVSGFRFPVLKEGKPMNTESSQVQSTEQGSEISRVLNQVSGVGREAAELSRIADQVAEGVETQTSGLNDAATGIQEMNASLK